MKKIPLILFSFIFIYSCKSDNSQERLTIQKDDFLYKVEAFEIDTGWGYKIWIDDKIYIKQEAIPAVNGIFLFETKENAEITGIYVMEKLANGQNLPSVNFNELDSLGVLYNDVIEYQKIDFGTKTGLSPGN